jgi:preprotein translocase subunit SecG
MGAIYNILLMVAIVVAVFFILIVYATGKGDAISGGASSIRTTYRGKASFDDYISRLTLTFGVAFIALMIILNFLSTSS